MSHGIFYPLSVYIYIDQFARYQSCGVVQPWGIARLFQEVINAV